MSDKDNKKLEALRFQDLSRESLYKKFFDDSNPAVSIEEIEDQYASAKEDIRYESDKRIFLELLMDPQLDNHIELRKNAKYDYMIGLLLYVASKSTFGYNFGYFKENIVSFDKILEGWSSLLDAIVKDISVLPDIKLKQSVIIECADILEITVLKDSILEVCIDLNRVENIFLRRSDKYSFNLRITAEYGSTQILESGESDGSGDKSGLYSSIQHINEIANKGNIKISMLTALIHGN